jgi:hypothetical protein
MLRLKPFYTLLIELHPLPAINKVRPQVANVTRLYEPDWGFAAASVAYPALTQAVVPPVTFRKFVNPCCSRMLVPALER